MTRKTRKITKRKRRVGGGRFEITNADDGMPSIGNTILYQNQKPLTANNNKITEFDYNPQFTTQTQQIEKVANVLRIPTSKPCQLGGKTKRRRKNASRLSPAKQQEKYTRNI
jgi:hypothetical protein